MNLSLLLLFLLLLLRIPAFLLPRNRLKIYLYSAIFAFLVIGIIGIFDRVGGNNLEERMGRFFSPLYSFLFKPLKGIKELELHHVYCYLANSLLYCVSFLIVLPLFSFFIGDNPSVHHRARLFTRSLLSISFLLFTYGVLFTFVANLRFVIPLPSGIREPVFNRFYSIGA